MYGTNMKIVLWSLKFMTYATVYLRPRVPVLRTAKLTRSCHRAANRNLTHYPFTVDSTCCHRMVI